MCVVPLTNVTGYEFSAVISILGSFLTGLKVIGYKKKLSSLYTLSDLLKSDSGFFTVFFVIPLVISVTNTLLFQICPPYDGILFYVVFVLPAMLVGVSLGAAVLNSFNKFNTLIYILLYLLILLLSLIEIYFRPQIYLYHSIFTFFPGTMYDDLIEVDSKLFLFRCFSLLPFLIVLLYTLNLKNHSVRIKLLPVVGLLILYSIYFLLKPQLGFSTTENVLKKKLIGQAVTPNFIINYPASISEDQVNNLILHHEFYFKKLTEQTAIDYENKIQSFVFQSREQKRKLFGAGNADVAKPWLNQIYTQYESFNTSLKHEMSHIFASKVGSTIFKVADNLNPSMIEGYAMAVENNYSGYDIHFLAKVAKSAGYQFPIPDLFEGFNFLGGTSSISYIYAGSFIKFIADEYGIDKVNLLYSDLNFRHHLNRELDELSVEYNDFLDDLTYQPDSSKAQLFFGRQSLFKRNCPRVTAQKIKDAWEHYSDSEYQSAFEIFDKTYKYSASYSALIGSIQSLRILKQFDNAINLLNNEIINFQNSGYYFNLLFRLGELYGLNKMFEKADSVYSLLYSVKPNEVFGNAVKSRKILMKKSKQVYSDYLSAERVERFHVLTGLINKSNYEVLLPIILELAKRLEISESSINRILSKIGISKRLANYYFYNELSNWYLEANEWKVAKFYAQLASVVAEKYHSPIADENLEKCEWISNFADSILTNVKFN